MTGPLDLNRPIPTASWMKDALCAQSFCGDMFFAEIDDCDAEPEGDDRATNPRALVRRQTQAAIAMCQQCPVIRECGKYADELNVKEGVWAGKDYSPIGRMGHHANRTHCPRNHEYTPENTRVAKSGRKCRACDALTSASRKRATGRTAA